MMRAVDGSSTCPVAALKAYLSMRPIGEGELFVHADARLLTRYQFSVVLRLALCKIGLDAHQFASHSFCIGEATSAAVAGFGEQEIQQIGRWRSRAFHGYVHPGNRDAFLAASCEFSFRWGKQSACLLVDWPFLCSLVRAMSSVPSGGAQYWTG